MSDHWFGLQPPERAVRAWGARAIYQHGTKWPIDLLPDRQSWRPDEQPPAEFEEWVNQIGLAWLRKEVTDLYLSPASEEVLRHDDGPYTIEASPRRSHGYLYIVAYERGVDDGIDGGSEGPAGVALA